MKVCTIIWTDEDVLTVAKDRAKPVKLTEIEIENILTALEQTHDATLGITWDTVDFWIDRILDKRGLI